MDILVRVGILVVMPVMGGPPKRPLLAAGSAPESHDELEEAAGLVGAMGEIPVVDPRNGEHAEVVHEDAHGDGDPTDTGQEGEDADDVNAEESGAAAPVDLLFFGEFTAKFSGERLFVRFCGSWILGFNL